jgi:recombinational DNA repair protein (RecF pathway)
MAYQTYITEALVCGSYDSNTADRSFLLFTKEAGMIYAKAKSVREERSKQRYALQACSHIRATLIRGKSGWKIAGVEPIQNLYSLTTTREARAFLRNTILLLRRVIHGETVYGGIFDDVIDTCMQAEKYAHSKLESVLALRVLHALGYVAPAPSYDKFLHCAMPYHYIELLTSDEEKMCREAIDHALMQSQL